MHNCASVPDPVEYALLHDCTSLAERREMNP